MEGPDQAGHLVDLIKPMLLGPSTTSNRIPHCSKDSFGSFFWQQDVLPKGETIIYVTSEDPFSTVMYLVTSSGVKNGILVALKGFFPPPPSSTWVIYFFLSVGYFLCSFPKHRYKKGSKGIKIKPSEVEMAYWVAASCSKALCEPCPPGHGVERCFKCISEVRLSQLMSQLCYLGRIT